MSPSLRENLDQVLARIRAAAVAAGRGADEVDLLAVTKKVSAGTALALARLGQRELGESRADELVRKAARFAEAGEDVRWHFIGPLQRNKARRVVRVAHAIHSVDRPELLEALDRLALEEGRRLDIYLEVKLSGEAEKHGFAPEELAEAVEAARAAEGLRPLGLMTMAPRPAPGESGAEAARATFGSLARLGQDLSDGPQGACFTDGRCRLSMGMSGDLEQAIAAGADIVRVGSALYQGLERSEEARA